MLKGLWKEFSLNSDSEFYEEKILEEMKMKRCHSSFLRFHEQDEEISYFKTFHEWK